MAGCLSFPIVSVSLVSRRDTPLMVIRLFVALPSLLSLLVLVPPPSLAKILV
jgi:hypothetical protein